MDTEDDGNIPEQELPGMWSNSDFTGGKEDFTPEQEARERMRAEFEAVGRAKGWRLHRRDVPGADGSYVNPAVETADGRTVAQIETPLRETIARLEEEVSNFKTALKTAQGLINDKNEKIATAKTELASKTGALEISEKMGKAVVQQLAAAQAVIKGKDDALQYAEGFIAETEHTSKCSEVCRQDKDWERCICGKTNVWGIVKNALALTPNHDVLDEYVREQIKVAVANLPESVIDAPRYFLQGLELGIKNCRPMREHLLRCGCEIDYLPAWFLDDSTTYITKAGKAIIIYAMMVHALPPTTKEGR